MTINDDCPSQSNNSVPASLKRILEVAAKWIEQLPAIEAHNASRLHTANIINRREFCDQIDSHRKTPEGRAAYNAEERARYAEKIGHQPREYVTGLPDDAKAERERQQNSKAQAKHRSKKSTAEQSAARKERRWKERQRKVKERERAEAEADASIEARRIF